MAADLLARLRAARETWATVQGVDFLLRRPTDVQLLRLVRREGADLLRLCLVGWRGVRLNDVVPGGDDAPAPFDLEMAIEWLEDRPALYSGLVDAVIGMINQRVERLVEAEKK